MGHKLTKDFFVGISPWRVSNPCDGDIWHSARRSDHSATEDTTFVNLLVFRLAVVCIYISAPGHYIPFYSAWKGFG